MLCLTAGSNPAILNSAAPCVDSATFAILNFVTDTCVWASIEPDGRCNLRIDSDKLIQANCPVSCGICTPPKSSKGPIQVVLGWSTGHTGTQTLAAENTFSLHGGKIPRDTLLIRHEMRAVPRSVWAAWGVQEEINYVNNTYWGHIEGLVSGMKENIFFDPGHHTLFFYNGLLDDKLLNSADKVVTLVRLRRNRYETAYSLPRTDQGLTRHGHGRDGRKDEEHNRSKKIRSILIRDICLMRTSLCPFDRPSEAATALPSRALWEQLTPFQKALWYYDEVDARWMQLQERYPPSSRRKYVTTELWSKTNTGSFERMVSTFAGLLHLNRSDILVPMNSHIGAVNAMANQTAQLDEFRRLDCNYRRALASQQSRQHPMQNYSSSLVAPFAPPISCATLSKNGQNVGGEARKGGFAAKTE